jgi:CRISPR/Cas system-associated endonuclease Cas3-HD
MNVNLLEFWGQTFLNAARSQQQLENMNKLLGENISNDNPMVNSIFKAFGVPKPEKVTPEDLIGLTQKSTDAYKEFFKSSLGLFEVVSKEDHLKVVKENEELKEKIATLEKIISDSKKRGDEELDQQEVVNNMAQIMKSQTQQFQELMKSVNQYYKKPATAKKK